MGILYTMSALLATLAICTAMQFEIQMVGENEENLEKYTLDVDDEIVENEIESAEGAEMIFNNEKEKNRKEYIDSANIELPVGGFGRPGKLPKELEMHLTFGDGYYSAPWSQWSCCSKRNNQQSRSQTQGAQKVMMFRSCHDNFCSDADECVDKNYACTMFQSAGFCKTNTMLMEKICPKACNLCKGPVKVPKSTPKSPISTKKPWRPTTTRRPWRPTTTRQPWRPTTTRKPWRPTTTKKPWRPTTTRKPWRPTTTRKPWRPTTTRKPWRPTTTRKPWRPTTTRKPWRPTTTAQKPTTQKCHSNKDVTTLYISYRMQKGMKVYKFSTNTAVVSPWRRVTSTANGELKSISLYTRRDGIYRVPIYFCRSGSGQWEKWQVSNRECLESRGWKQVYTLYASTQRNSCALRLFGAQANAAPWSSRISSSNICCGYISNIFAFYAPDMDGMNSGVQPTLPTFTNKPATTTTTAKPKPPVDIGGLSSYNKECLQMHNFFRAIHGVPALRWSPILAKSAQAWANQLKRIAPENPGKLVHPQERTRNWPHSKSDGPYRGFRVGENIAWDMSSDGSSAKETVLRWYSEILYYDRNNPTVSKPNRPVGHVTQLLWKETTEVGCGDAVHHFSFGRFETRSSWAVAHYNPTGNIHYRSTQDTNRNFDKMVPNFLPKTCMTKASCKFENQCMGFGKQRTSSCQCNQKQPVCTGDNGCIAWCKRQDRNPTFYLWNEECIGKKTCKCSTTPIKGVAGAICE